MPFVLGTTREVPKADEGAGEACSVWTYVGEGVDVAAVGKPFLLGVGSIDRQFFAMETAHVEPDDVADVESQVDWQRIRD